MIVKESMMLGDLELSLETGVLAKQAHGSVVVRLGDNMVLATCCGEEEANHDKDFFPLMVEYRETYYAAGRFPGGFVKREGKLSTRETLICRLIDRPMRPLFDENYVGDTQVSANVISFDGLNETDIMGMIGAAAAAYISPLPFPTPFAAIRIGYSDGEFIINPNIEQKAKSDLDLVVAATETSILMVEAGANIVPESVILDALDIAHTEIKKIIEMIKKMADQLKIQRWEVTPPPEDESFLADCESTLAGGMLDALRVKGKKSSEKALSDLKKSFVEPFTEDEDKYNLAKRYFSRIK